MHRFILKNLSLHRVLFLFNISVDVLAKIKEAYDKDYSRVGF